MSGDIELTFEPLAERCRSIAEVSPEVDITGPAAAVRLYDVVELARGRRRPDHQRPRGTANMPTTYRVVLETETRPREAAVAIDHLPAIQVDAPNVDIAARLALAHHIDSRPIPPPAGTSFGLLVITPPPHDPNVPHHDLDDEPEIHHLNVEYWPNTTAAH